MLEGPITFIVKRTKDMDLEVLFELIDAIKIKYPNATISVEV